MSLAEVYFLVGANVVLMEGTILPENITLYGEVINNFLRGLPCSVVAVSGESALVLIELPLF